MCVSCNEKNGPKTPCIRKGAIIVAWQWMQFLAFLFVTGYGLYLFGKVVYHRYIYMKLGKQVEIEKKAR